MAGIEAPARPIVKDYRTKHPCAKLMQVAAAAGVTKQHASQILQEENLPTRPWRQRYLCNQCGKLLPGNYKYFCNKGCKSAYLLVTLECSLCGTLFQRPLSWLRRDIKNGKEVFYCSRECWGRHIAKKYGFGTKARETKKLVQ